MDEFQPPSSFPGSRAAVRVSEGQTRDDGVFTIMDYLNALFRRWKVFVAVVLAFLAIGFLYFKSLPVAPYEHTAIIEIANGADGNALESAQKVAARLEEAYIPVALKSHAQEYGYDEQRYVVTAQIPKDATDLIALRAPGDLTDTKDLVEIEQRIADLLIKDHKARLEGLRAALEQERDRIALSLVAVKDREKFLPRKRASILEEQKLLLRQIENATGTVRAAEQDRTRLLAKAVDYGGSDRSFIDLVLLIDNTIAEQRDKVRILENQLHVVVNDKRTAVDKEEFDLKAEQRQLQLNTVEAEKKLEHLGTTRLLARPTRLPGRLPSANRVQGMAIVGLTGLIAGLFAVAVFETASRSLGRRGEFPRA